MALKNSPRIHGVSSAVSLGSLQGRDTVSGVYDTGIDLSSLPENYKDLAASNPFLNYDYTPTIMDKIGNFFGFGTAEDKFRTDMQLAARQFDSQLLSTAREEEYNLPINQVARDRAAGLNPDLLGVSGSQASEFNEPEASPQAPDGSQEIQQFAGNMLSVFTTTMGLVKDVTSLSSFIEDVSAKRTANVQSFLDTARGYILDRYDPSGWSLSDEDTVDFYNGRGFALDVDDQNRFAETMYSSKRDRRRFMKALDQVRQSLPTEVAAYKLWYERESNRREYAKLRSSSFYSDNDKEMTDFIGVFVRANEDLDKALQGLTSHRYEVENEQLDAEHAQAQNDIAYQNTLDPVAEANAVNEGNRKAAASDQTEREINQVYQSIVHELSAQASQGSRWAQIGLLVISAIRMMSMPRYSSQRSSKVNSKGQVEEQTSSSFGF